MEVINNISISGFEEISQNVEKALSEINYAGYQDNPLIFVETYTKSNNHELKPIQMYGLLKIPIYMNNDPCDEGDTAIHLPLRHDALFLKTYGGKWEKIKGDLSIPLGSKLIDVESLLKKGDQETIHQVAQIKGANIFKLYVGHSAYTKLAEFSHQIE